MGEKVKCFICGTEFDREECYDDCPYCDWTYLGFEDELEEGEIDGANPITVAQAKEYYAQGKDIWGDPLKKKPE